MDKNSYRFCQKFDPEKHIVNGYLPVMHRLNWFHHYLDETRQIGHIDDSEFCVLPGIPIFVVKSTVMIDGKIVGRACSAGRYQDSLTDQTWGQKIATQAKGRALAHAGFGTEEALSKPDFITNADVPKDTLRSCDYDPRLDLMFVNSADSDVLQPYLRVPFRIKWFHHYLATTHFEGYIDSSKIYYDATNELLVATASVYINNNEVGKSIASLHYAKDAPAWEMNPVATVCTQAVGRALLNAGFGVTAWGNEDGVDEELCDAPIITSTAVVSAVKTTAEKDAEAEFPAPIATELPQKKKRGRKPKVSAETPASSNDLDPHDQVATPAVPDAAPISASSDTKMTRAEGLQYVMPIGPYAGKTIGEIISIKRGMVEFYAGENFNNPKYTLLKKAAIAALDQTS